MAISKKAMWLGAGALGCFGMFFMVLLIVGGIGAVAFLSKSDAPAQEPGQEQPARPAQNGDAPAQPAAEPAAPADDQPARNTQVSESVALEGQVVDAATGQGISGAYFVVLTPGKTIADLQQSKDPQGDGILEAGAITDGSGNYQVKSLRRGYTYTVVAAADGYQTTYKDNGLEINGSDPETTRLQPIQLQKN